MWVFSSHVKKYKSHSLNRIARLKEGKVSKESQGLHQKGKGMTQSTQKTNLHYSRLQLLSSENHIETEVQANRIATL